MQQEHGAGRDESIVAEISYEDGDGLVVLAERLPRGSRVRTRRSDARRLAALLARARARAAAPATDEWHYGEWHYGEPPAELANHELCSAHFLSGAGWAWRVTAALAKTRDDGIPLAPHRRRVRPGTIGARAHP